MGATVEHGYDELTHYELTLTAEWFLLLRGI